MIVCPRSSSLSERTNEVGQERDYRVRFVHYRGAGRLWRPPTHPRWVRKRYFNHLSDKLLESIINAHPEGWTWFLAGSLLWRVDEFIDPELYNSLIDSIAQGILDTVREEHRQAVSQLSMVAPKQLIHIVKELLKRQDSKLTDTVAILVRGVIEDGIRHRTVVPFLLTALDLVYISDFVVNVTSTIGEPVVLPLIDVVKLGTTTAKIAAV